MRIAVSVAVAAMVLGSASSAMAADAPVPLGATSLAVHDVVTGGPLVEARFGSTDEGVRRTRTLVGDQFATEAPLRHRLGSRMMEYYPVANSGFHLSAGARFFNVTNFNREAEKLSSLLWSPTNPSFGSVRTGFRRKTPAMTAGYTQTFADRLALGVEAGTLLGRVNANMPGALGRTLSETGMSMRLNPVAAFTMGMKF